MYLEFLLIVNDYFKTLNKKYVFFEWGLPFVIAILIFYLFNGFQILEPAKKFIDTSITLLGIFVGFSITVITLLNTANNDNVQEIKKSITEVTIGGRKITLFQLLLVNMTYSVVVEIISIIFNLCLPLFLFKISCNALKIILSLDLFLILHILMLTIRNITDFYFILFKRTG